jgi:diguanylate cyclase (GGDEF)-like protein
VVTANDESEDLRRAIEVIRDAIPTIMQAFEIEFPSDDETPHIITQRIIEGLPGLLSSASSGLQQENVAVAEVVGALAITTREDLFALFRGMSFIASACYQALETAGVLSPLSVREIQLRVQSVAAWSVIVVTGAGLQELANLSFRDSLTNLLNERAFERDVELLESDATPMVVVSIDLDGLKRVNDAGTHQDGNRYIKRFTSAVARSLPDNAAFYRPHGDEFTILIRTNALSEAQALLAELSQEGGMPAFSYGCAIVGTDGETATDAMRIADERMYEMKRQHKRGS